MLKGTKSLFPKLLWSMHPCRTAEDFIKYHSMNFSSRNPDLYALVWSQNLHRRNNSPSDCHRSLWISLNKIKILKQLPILSNSLEILSVTELRNPHAHTPPRPEDSATILALVFLPYRVAGKAQSLKVKGLEFDLWFCHSPVLVILCPESQFFHNKGPGRATSLAGANIPNGVYSNFPMFLWHSTKEEYYTMVLFTSAVLS